MKKHSARVAPLSACNSPVLTLTKVEGKRRRWERDGDGGVSRGKRVSPRGMLQGEGVPPGGCSGESGYPHGGCSGERGYPTGGCFRERGYPPGDAPGRAGTPTGDAPVRCPPPGITSAHPCPPLRSSSPPPPGAPLRGPGAALKPPGKEGGRMLDRCDPAFCPHLWLPIQLRGSGGVVGLRPGGTTGSPTAVGGRGPLQGARGPFGDFQGSWVGTLKRAVMFSVGFPESSEALGHSRWGGVGRGAAILGRNLPAMSWRGRASEMEGEENHRITAW